MGSFNIFDIVVVLIIVWGSYKGFKKGFINSLGRLVGWLGSIFVAFKYKQILAKYLDKQYDLISIMGQGIAKVLPLPNFSFEADYLSPAIASAGVNEMNIPYFLKINLMDNIDQLLIKEQFLNLNLSEIISYGLGGTVLNGLCFMALFIGTGLVIKLIFNVLSALFSFTPLKIVNRLSGMAMGLVVSLFITVFIAGLFYPLVTVSTVQSNNALVATVYSSYSYPFLLDLYTIVSNSIW